MSNLGKFLVPLGGLCFVVMIMLDLGNFLVLLGGLFFVAVGLFSLAQALFNIGQARKSTRWPKTLGKIETAKVVESSGEYGTSYGVDIVYTYAVDELTYRSKRVFFGDWPSIFGLGKDVAVGGSPEVAKQRLALYSPGSEVTVYYDPMKPKESVLEPGPAGLVYVDVVVDIVFAIGGFWMFQSSL